MFKMVINIKEEIDAKYFTIPFDELVEKNPELAIYALSVNPVKFDLGNPEVLSKVNQYLYKTVLGLDLTVPKEYLIPTLGIRYAYCNAVVERINSPYPCLEIGTGASAAISMILATKFQKKVIATEVNVKSSISAMNNIEKNDLVSKIKLLKSEGEFLKNLIPKGEYSALLCYPPLYEADLTRLDKKRGWKGIYDELIGGGKDGMNFINKLIEELLSPSGIVIELATLLLSSKKLLSKIMELLPKSAETEIIQINAGTRKRFILIFRPSELISSSI